MAYTAFDPANPTGSQTGSAFATSTLANFLTLRDAILAGRMTPSWTMTASGGTAERPATRTWSDGGTRRLRATFTYNADGYRVDSIAWDYSTNSGSLYESMGTSESWTFDGSLNVTATTASSWLSTWLHELWAKFLSLRATYNAHAASSSAHSMGSIATQSAASVAITGGSVTNVTLEYNTARGKIVNLGNITGSVAIDWSLGDFFYGTVTGISTLSWSNLPSGKAGSVTLELTNPGAFSVTWPSGVKWPGALAPSRTASGVDLYEFVCRDGSIVRGAQAQKDSR